MSSELKSQLISKQDAFQILVRQNPMLLFESQMVHHIQVEAWYIGLKISLKKAYRWPGISTVISWKEVIEWQERKISLKSFDLAVEQKGKKLFLVSSFQSASKKYAVVVHNEKDCNCECMYFKMLQKRLKKEAPKLYELMDRKITCHHIEAALNEIYKF